MSHVRSADTKPELLVRKLVHGMGFRYRLHRKELPGTPDLVFVGLKKVIFVNGCFWHGHSCKRGTIPATHTEFWQNKIQRNKERDEQARKALETLGWQSVDVWECELRDTSQLKKKLKKYLGPRKAGRK
jgi:DNA mismatch endonuclease (patch repair protein)